MCPSGPKPGPRAASGLPTTQALDELQLAGNAADLAPNVYGRQALNTRGRSTRTGTTAASSVDPLGMIQQAASTPAAPAAEGDPLGFQGEGRKLGSRQAFFEAGETP